MARRKNVKRIDPRYFMDEKTERSSTIELMEGLTVEPSTIELMEGLTMELTPSGLDYIKGLIATGDLRDKVVARALLVTAEPSLRARIPEEEFQELRKTLTNRDRTLYLNNM
jgi:hypothetical protein|tara:strand:- start:105 stop:440 length:336 start_codon:yes stop_codon:yes gene_type:complete